MPDTIETLIATFRAELLRGFDELASGNAFVTDWYEETKTTIAVIHRVAWMVGQGSKELLPSAEARIDQIVNTQNGFLEAFANEVADTLDEDTASWATWRNRIQMYGDAVYATASEGKYQYWTLPAHPGDGSQICLTNCRCHWEAHIDGPEEDLNGDFYWRLGGTDHCDTCVGNAARWNPLRIRDGVMQ